jgi:chromate reductase, NAD(P)H dehydrogenase (quinone)
MKVLAISGSLRAASINSALLRAACRLAPAEVAISLFSGLGELPHFNPDLEGEPPSSVRHFRAQVGAADALLIASPEYAHGLTGVVKNGLDWLVSYEPFAYKPVAVLNASPRAHHADAALREVLKTMAAVIVESASVTIPLLGSGLDEDGMVNTPSTAAAIRESLGNLYEAVALHRVSQAASFPLR